MLSALSTECLNCEIVSRDHVAALLARAARLGLRLRQAFALDHVVAEYNDGARHLADFVARVRRRYTRGGIAIGKPFHDRGKAVQRPRDAAADQPAETKAERDHGNSHHDNAGAGSGLRFVQAPRSVVCGVARILDDFIGARQHVLAVDVDDRPHGADAVVAFDPILKRVGVGFHLLFESRLHLGRAVDVGKGVGKFLVASLELLPRDFVLVDPVVRLVVTHEEQRHH